MFLTRFHKPEVSTWPTLDRLSSLHDEIDRLFESPWGDLARNSVLWRGWSPAVDVYEQKDGFIVRAELPGMKKEDISVSWQDGALSISGERKPDAELSESELYRSERFFGKFHRSIALPNAVDATQVKASYCDGVLSVTLPKTDEVKPKQIEVTVK